MNLSIEKLAEIHGKVYRKRGYSTFKTGLRAFRRGRGWAQRNEGTAKPPSGIADKLLLWAEVNKEINIEIIRQREEKSLKQTREAQLLKFLQAPAGTRPPCICGKCS